MFDIGDKNRLISEIQNEIQAYATYKPLPYIESQTNANDLIREIVYRMSQEIAKDIAKQVVYQIITRLYTYSELERDLGLRD